MNNEKLWAIREAQFDPARQNHSETVFTIGNGYLCTRGSMEESYPGENRTTFLHGVFDDIPIVFTELANAPDWLEMQIFLAGELFRLNMGEILAFRRELDLRNGLLRRSIRWRSPQGRITLLEFERFASLANPHTACLRVSITPENYAGSLEIRAGLNGEVDNLGYKHWDWLEQSSDQDAVHLLCRTRASGIQLAVSAHLHLSGPSTVESAAWDTQNHPTLVKRSSLQTGETARIEKTVVYFTSRDQPEPSTAARSALSALPLPAWNALWPAHAAAWEKYWQTSDVVIEGDDEAQLAVRFSIFQLLIVAPRSDERVNIGAKTLSGHGYRGHAFWDTEIFMLPFFTYTQPGIARNLLSYRCHNLDGARRKAKANGFLGAQYPWESAATGDEVTPTWLPHYADRTKIVRIWTGDIEIHISAMVCYALLQYWRATGDDEFIINRAAEVFIEVARFWASRAEWDRAHNRYEFNDVIGPDENHDHIDNNAYTNAFARWTLHTADELMGWLEKNAPQAASGYRKRLNLEPAEQARWRSVADKIYWPYDLKTGLLEQFEGYFQRRDVDLKSMEPRNESVQQILGIEGASLVQVLKQPDVLMLAYLLPALFDERSLVANYEYYTPRTDLTYGSSLGPSIQAIMACKVGKVEDAYENFMRAARADLVDVRGNASDGIHGANAGGIWQAIVFGFGGLRFTPDGWEVKPQLPPNWKHLTFRFTWRGKLFVIDLPNAGPFSSEGV